MAEIAPVTLKAIGQDEAEAAKWYRKAAEQVSR